ncbi:MAG: acyl-CoA desaturase, partial [Actinobacteria bacterium]|nr:acyl-CoA desaturase [Actinomycetota bacterium]
MSPVLKHLTEEDVNEIGRRLDAIRDEVLADRGEADAAYIHRLI